MNYTTEEEVWKDIPGYTGSYQASNLGRVRSLDRVVTNNLGVERRIKGQVLAQEEMHDGYKKVPLSQNGKVRKRPVHRLVAKAFIPNPKRLPIINHKNEIKDDNRVSNLEWCTQSYNVKYGNGIEKMMSNEGWRTTRNNIRVKRTDLDTGETFVYDSLREADRNGFVRTSISRCIRRGDAIYKNNKWEYV